MGPDIDDEITLINENQTRKRYIDPVLEKMGWYKKYIKEEVNSVKSDFNANNFVFFNGNIERNVDRFIDYILLEEDYSVLAIIEAKRFSINEEKGRIQARSYAKDIERQINRKIPIFLTNGHVWRFIDEQGIERKVSAPFTQEDLRRRGNLFKNKLDPRDIRIDTHIVDRVRSVQIVKELSEHFAKGHRKALVQMATGTGKTRVAMAIIKLLIDANMIRHVLFIADRTALVNQAKTNGFKAFFSEPVTDLRNGFSTTGRLYVSTIQTLMSGNPTRLFEQFSPGFFDLIVFDEAHRSIYDKNNMINGHFDAIKIGLTATPREHELKNTYDLFDCESGKPTIDYSYDEALRDKVLVPYKADIIETNILSSGIKGSKLDKYLKDQLRRQELEPDKTEFTGSQFDKVFMDDKTNALIIHEFMKLCYKSGEGKPCKTIFFCASRRHAQHMKNMFGLLFPNLSSDVQVITSNMSRAEDEVLRFQKESEPRIALSVGMLDTGVDIPEVCNLVFVKPVFSHIRFWQMVGRGTRDRNSCKHPGWLPDMEKNDFMIFDFTIGGHSNVKYHHFKTSQERTPQKDVITRIFENRVELLKKSLDENQKRIVSEKIMYNIEALGVDSFIVREKMPVINTIKDNSFNLEQYVNELMKEIAPLMILNQGVNANVSSFILQAEKLFGMVLERKRDQIDKIGEYVIGRVQNVLLKDTLIEVQQKRESLIKVIQSEFWDDLTFDDVEFMIKEVAPLMKYYEPDPRKVVQVDAPDLVMSREKFEKEVTEDPRIKELLDSNAIVNKIREGKCITSHELMRLEAKLSKLNPLLTIENVQKYQDRDFLLFLWEVIGLSREDDPRDLIERRFDEYIIESSYYTSKQIEFLGLLKKIFADRKHIDMKDLGEQPFSDEHPLDYFSWDELEKIVTKCNKIKMC